MDIKSQIIIKSNPILKQYLRENSQWYKILLRNENSIKLMEEKMKKKYKITSEDKLKKVSKDIEMVKSIVDLFK